MYIYTMYIFQNFYGSSVPFLHECSRLPPKLGCKKWRHSKCSKKLLQNYNNN